MGVTACWDREEHLTLFSQPGTAIITPFTEAAKAGAVIGGAEILTQPRTRDNVHVHVGP